MEVVMIPLHAIVPNPFQPREWFEDDSLHILAESFKRRGILEPIIVRKQDKSYQIIAGERRWRAAALAGLEKIPAIVKTMSDAEIAVESLVENIHRKDLTDVERENAIHHLWTSGRFKSTSELADALGLRDQSISDDLDAWEFRKKNNVKEAVPTYIIARTNSLQEENRKAIVRKYETSEIRAIDVYSLVKTLKRASGLLKETVLARESPITPELAELIVEKLPDPSEQDEIVNEIKRKKLDEIKTRTLMETLRLGKRENGTYDVVGEMDTGLMLKCPLCDRSYRIFHNEPRGTHSLKEL